MTNSRTQSDYDDTEDLLMNDEADFSEDSLDEEQEEVVPRTRSFNLDMRHRIEEKLEERRLMKELNEYEFFDIDDDEDTLH